MKKIVFILCAAAVGLTLRATAVHAQGTAPDHLICYNMKDPLKFATPPTLDMLADLQPEFSQKGCRLIKPVQFCVPANKTNVRPAPPLPNISGQPLQNDYICYKAECPKLGPPAKVVTDQFGQRPEQKFQAVTVCVPAIKTPLGCPVGSTNAGMCGGVCPDSPQGPQQCRFDRKAKVCTCVPQATCPKKPDKFGACGGTCPQVAGQPQEVCLPAIDPATHAPTCLCQPPPPPVCSVDPATGQCGGTCPNDPTKTCAFDASGQCTCQTPCGKDTTGACGGVCPVGQCTLDSTGACTCPPVPCGGSPNPLTGACGGTCPPGTNTTCQLAGGACQCLPLPCSSDAAGVCGGRCQIAGQECFPDASGACNCQTPCGFTTPGANTCGGGCPSGTTCQLSTAGTAITCVCK